MKKKIIIILLVLFIVTGIGLSIYFSLDKTQEQVLGLNTYTLHLKIEDNFEVVSLNQEFEFTNNIKENLETVEFNLYPNAYDKDAKYPAYDKKLERYGNIEILKAEVEDKESVYDISQECNLLKITFKNPLKLKEKVNIVFEAKINIPISSLRLGTYNEVLNLCNFYPILAVYEKDGWRNDRFSVIGDPFYSEVANYKVTVECDDKISIAHTGILQEEINAENNIKYIEANKVRDFALVASKRFQYVSDKYKDIEIKYYYLTDKEFRESLNLAKDAIRVFSESFGEYPYKQYTLVETNFSHGGMEYPNLSLISDKNKGTYKAETIIHETAHQWFSCLVGSDSILNPWLDEGLTSFATNFYFVLINEKTKYNELRDKELTVLLDYTRYMRRYEPKYNAYMKKGIYSFNSDYEYSIIAYTKANLMFDAVYKNFGRYNTVKTIRILVEKYSYKNISEAEFLEVFNQVVKGKGLLDSWLEGKVVFH